MISIKIYGYLNRYTDGRSLVNLDIEDEINLYDILEKLHIPGRAVGFVSVNGVLVDINYQPGKDDQIKIYPLVMGG